MSDIVIVCSLLTVINKNIENKKKLIVVIAFYYIIFIYYILNLSKSSLHIFLMHLKQVSLLQNKYKIN
jgi:hypothetical protein